MFKCARGTVQLTSKLVKGFEVERLINLYNLSKVCNLGGKVLRVVEYVKRDVEKFARSVIHFYSKEYTECFV